MGTPRSLRERLYAVLMGQAFLGSFASLRMTILWGAPNSVILSVAKDPAIIDRANGV
jgi:hypothetical protein